MRVHANAPWTPRRRRQLIRAVAEQRLAITDAAELGGVSERTVYRWLARWRDGDRLLEDRSSAPHRCPHALPRQRVELVERLRRQRWTVPEIAGALAMPTSTVTAVCARLGLNRLSKLDPPEPPNRYQRRHPGELIHVDIKKLGMFATPGHQVRGRRSGHDRNRGAGWEHVHVAVDDCTRLAYAEVLDEGETSQATTEFLARAVAWFAARGITVTRVMTDNGSGYRSHAWRQTCATLGLKHLTTRPYRPRTNGKAERFIQMLQRQWAYGTAYPSSQKRREAFPAWLHYYNHHRPHGSLNRETPGQRLHALTNPDGIYT